MEAPPSAPTVPLRHGGEMAGWYLGLDIGTTGISAVLSNPLTGQSHPLYWQANGEALVAAQDLDAERTATATTRWRLPAIAHLPSDFANDEAQAPIQLPIPGIPDTEGVLIRDIKAAFDVGLPYQPETSETDAGSSPHDWEPQLNWYFQPAQPQRSLPEQAPVSLNLIMRVLKQLLSTLNPVGIEAKASGSLSGDRTVWPLHRWCCGAKGLSGETLTQILATLEGIIVSCPSDCNEAYRFNIREAVLQSQLAQRPEQISFLEEPVASLLAEFHPSQGQAFNPSDWQGATLVVHAGAASTELAVVCMPNGLHNLTHEDFKLRSFGYGEQAFKQDIACQLLAPFIPEEQLGLDLAILPIPGEPDLTVRSQLQRQLYRGPAGKMLLEASVYLQKALKQQERITFEFGPYACTFSQTAMDTKVIQPFVMRLNRELNRLFGEAGISADGINQILCTGSHATLPAIQTWLQETLPQARLVGDLQDQAGVQESGVETTDDGAAFLEHRVAYGLVSLPVYAQVLDRAQQQYSDYFLLAELLRSLPNEALTTNEILGHLEGQGINTQVCQERILNILSGQIPSGLMPEPSDVWAAGTNPNAHYRALQIKPLFTQPSPTSYQIDREQRQRFLDYWSQVTRHTDQTLAEPYILELGATVGAA